ncbi:MAG: MFS transporter [Anaerolineae bacterium]|nr:MFS transporter [Anaerolineae bacterium]
MSNALSSSEQIVVTQHVLASRNFRLLWLGQAISTFGDKFSEIAIPILVYSITGSALQLGLAFLTQTVAALLFGLFAGVMADRWNRQHTMIWSDVIRAILVFALLVVPLLSASITTQLLILYGLSFAIAAVKQFFLPAKIATIPDTVHESQLMAANSLDQSTMTLVGFLGFAAAGLMVERLGAQTAFMIDGLTFFVSALCIVLMRLPLAETSGEASSKPAVLSGIRAGFVHVWSVPILRGTVLISLVAPLALGYPGTFTDIQPECAAYRSIWFWSVRGHIWVGHCRWRLPFSSFCYRRAPWTIIGTGGFGHGAWAAIGGAGSSIPDRTY